MKKRKFLVFILIQLTIITGLIGQTSVSLTLDKDATLVEVAGGNNYGRTSAIACSIITFSGVPGRVKGVMQFDFSSIPAGAIIQSATLNLYGSNHLHYDKSTISKLERLNASWVESTVTWNNQPGVDTAKGKVTLAAATSTTQDYKLDVKSQIQDMIDDPANDFGFLLSLESDETPYASLQFYSSDHALTAKHPTLDITYTIDTEYFASLQREVTGSFYNAYESKLYFKYDEKYQSGDLEFYIYDDFRTIKLDHTTLTQPKNFGANWIYWNLTQYPALAVNNYYMLEVRNDKGVSEYLRFYLTSADASGSGSTTNSHIQHLSYPAK